MKYRKKPIIIDAFCLGVERVPEWFNSKDCSQELDENGKVLNLYISTLEGVMKANHGDYIIRGVNGEIYPCKPDIFRKTYELVYNLVNE